MEEDTRQNNSKAPPRNQSQNVDRSRSANIMPGGTANTAGGEKIEDYNLWSMLKSMRLSEYRHFHRLPCVRDALLVGIVGTCTGCGITVMMRRPVTTTIKNAIASFALPSWGMYEYCNYQRRREKEGVKKAVEIMDLKRVEKEKRARELKEKIKRELQEKERAEEEERKRKQWWKVW